MQKVGKYGVSLYRQGNYLYLSIGLRTKEAKSEENINYLKNRLRGYTLYLSENEYGDIVGNSSLLKIEGLR